YAPSKWLTGPFPFWVMVKFSQVGFGWVKCCAKKGVLCVRDGPPRSRSEGQEFLASPIPPETPRIVQGENLGHPSVPSCADQKFRLPIDGLCMGTHSISKGTCLRE